MDHIKHPISGITRRLHGAWYGYNLFLDLVELIAYTRCKKRGPKNQSTLKQTIGVELFKACRASITKTMF